jgi:hypothetical protein
VVRKKNTPSPKKKKRGPKPSKNVCWEWKQSGRCGMNSRHHKKQFDHSLEWRNYYNRV